MVTIWESELVNDSTDKLTKAILHSVLYVALELEHQRAVLLPWVCREFLCHYLGTSSEVDSESQEHVLESSEGTVKFSSRWVLKQLAVHLHSHMSSKCIHKKFGALLFTSLSWALGTGNFQSKEANFEVKPTQKPNYDKILVEAGDIINDVIHSGTTKNCSIDVIRNTDKFNIEKNINSIDPS